MWGWDPSQGEGPAGGTPSHTIVPSQTSPSTTPTSPEPLPVLVPTVEGLKQQFQQQQSLIAHIKETLRENDADRSSKEKKLEMYANKLSQIQRKSKNAQRKATDRQASPSKLAPRRTSRENLSSIPERRSSKENLFTSDSEVRKNVAKGKMNELKKQLEQNKLKFKEETERGLTDTKNIESKLEQLRTKVQERDVTIHELQKTMDTPPKPPIVQNQPRRFKDRPSSKYTQTILSSQSSEAELKIKRLEATIIDLEDTIKQQESVIAARTQAVTLLTKDLSKKGKSALDDLEDTRTEMRTLQAQFVIIENQLKAELVEKDNRLIGLEAKIEELKTTNCKLVTQNELIEEKLKEALQYSHQTTDDKVSELKQKIIELTNELQMKNQDDQDSKDIKNNLVAELQTKIVELSDLKNYESEKVLELLAKNEELSLVSNEESLKSAELQKKIDALTNISQNSSTEESENKKIVELQAKLAELTQELEDSNKLMIRLKLEHKNKLKAANKNIEKLKQSSDDKAEVLRLTAKVEELEALKEKHETKITELEVEKGAAEGYEQQIKDMATIIEADKAKIVALEKVIANHEAERQSLQLNFEDQTILVDNLSSRIQALEAGVSLEPFDVPGEAVSKQLDLSNENFQQQIQNLVLEKQELLEKLKSLSVVSSLDSISFEKLELVVGDAEIQDMREAQSTSEAKESLTDVEKCLAEEKVRNIEAQIKIAELQTIIFTLEEKNAEVHSKTSVHKLESKLSDTKSALEKEKDKVREIAEKLNDREKLIASYTERGDVDDWEGDWGKDSYSDLGETQKRCLSLENSLLELTEQCERLRKENIEVVHQLSEEKVRRKRVEDELDIATKTQLTLRESSELLESRVSSLEEAVTVQDLASQELREYQEKLEYANVVITGKDTEIFSLQNSLADRGWAIDELKEQLRVANEELMKSEADFNRVSNELTEVVTQSMHLEDLIEDRERALQELRGSLNHDTKKISEYEEIYHEQLENLERKVKELEQALMHKNDECSQLIGEQNKLRVSLESALKERDIAVEKGVQAEGILAFEKIECEELLKEKDEIALRLRQVEDNLSKGKEEFDRLVSERDQLLGALRENEVTHTRERQEFNLRIDETEKVLQKTWTERNDLIKSKDIVLQRLSASENELRVAQSHIHELTQTLAQIDSSQGVEDEKHKELETKLESKCKELSDLTVKAKKLAAALKKKNQTEKEMVDKLNKAVSERDLLASQSGKTTVAGDDELDRTVAEIKRLEEEKAELIAEKEQLMQEAETVYAQKLEAENALAEVEERNKTLEESLNNIKMSMESLATDKKELENKLSETLSKNDNMTETLKRMEALEQMLEIEEKENEALLLQRSSLAEEKSALEIQLQENRRKSEELSNEVKNVNDLLREARDLQSHLSEGYNTIQLENQNLSSFVENLTAENSKLVIQQKELIVNLSNKEKELDKLISVETGCDQLKEMVQSKETEIKKLMNQAVEMQKTFQDIEGDFNRAKVEAKNVVDQGNLSNIQLSQENIALKEHLAELNVKITELEGDVVTLTENNSQLELMSSETETFKEKFEKIDKESKRNVEQFRVEIEALNYQLVLASEQFKAENAKNNQLNEEITNLKSHLVQEQLTIQKLKETIKNLEESIEKKKTKSVSFKTDDWEYIKELREEVDSLQMALGTAKDEQDKLKTELVHERARVDEPLAVSKQIDLFQGAHDDLSLKPTETSDPFSEDSLTWDDGWGTEGQLEEEHALAKPTPVNDKKLEKLESDLKAERCDKEVILEELRVLQVKYSKMVKKLKEQKALIDRLQGEVKKLKQNAGNGDLDAAIIDELRIELTKAEAKASETRKELDSALLERDSLLKKIDVLHAGNERFLEMKERQDSDAAIWHSKNSQLLTEIEALKAQIEAGPMDENEMVRENKELKNIVEGLEWKVSELAELVEEKEEELSKAVESNNDRNKKALDEAREHIEVLKKEIEESKHSKESLLSAEESLRDLEDQLSLLAQENETLQTLLNEQKSAKAAPTTQTTEPPKILSYFQTSSSSDFFSDVSNVVPAVSDLPNQLEETRNRLKDKESELEKLLQEVENNRSANIKQEEFFKNEISALQNQIRSKESDLESLKGSTSILQDEIMELNNQLKAKELLSLSENYGDEGELRQKEQQIELLLSKVDSLERANNKSKAEILRLLTEEKLRSESERELASEKARHELLLKEKEAELTNLQESLGWAEHEWSDAQERNDTSVKALKVQLRDLDVETARQLELKETEIRELKAECAELRELCGARTIELNSLKQQLEMLRNAEDKCQTCVDLHQQLQVQTTEISDLRTELAAGEEERAHLTQLQLSCSECLQLRKWGTQLQETCASQGAEVANLREQLSAKELILNELQQNFGKVQYHLQQTEAFVAQKSERKEEITELSQILKERDIEVQELRQTLEMMQNEIRQFRSFDEQIRDLQAVQGSPVTSQPLTERKDIVGDWNTQEALDLSRRLQSDLDTAMNMLHQRDVRCDELTFELVQLLEERDTLQLRLSTALRASEELRTQKTILSSTGAQSKAKSSDLSPEDGNLAEKLTELHQMGYGRDKSIQDDTMQRHRDQMTLLGMEGRAKSNNVIDI